MEALYRAVQKLGTEIVDAPCEYPYVPGYYAMFFRDPDGIRIEYAHLPEPSRQAMA